MEFRSLTEPDIFNWVFLFLAIVLAGTHLYLGLFATFVAGGRATQFVVIGLALLFGPVVYFTSYWQPFLYLLGVGFAWYLGGLWLLGGMEYFQFGVLAGITATIFILLALLKPLEFDRCSVLNIEDIFSKGGRSLRFFQRRND